MRAERAQAARDPLFYACLTVALQDSIWAIGRPNAGDLCLRCHFTEGWTEDRSDPINASAMTGSDFDGAQCDLCHSLLYSRYHRSRDLCATGRGKDNRIPPRGFRVAEAQQRLCEPVSHGASAPGLFTAAEYEGGYDEVTLRLPQAAERMELRLYYQSTSREYVEFLRDEINGAAGAAATAPPNVPFL